MRHVSHDPTDATYPPAEGQRLVLERRFSLPDAHDRAEVYTSCGWRGVEVLNAGDTYEIHATCPARYAQK